MSLLGRSLRPFLGQKIDDIEHYDITNQFNATSQFNATRRQVQGPLCFRTGRFWHLVSGRADHARTQGGHQGVLYEGIL